MEQNIDGRVEEVENLINGKTDKLELRHRPNSSSSRTLSDIYYLLGDYYFKNKEWDIALYYYKRDLAVNPKRLDSWAGLSLAQKTQLETLLNSCEEIPDEEEFLRQVQVATVCFKHALLQDDQHSNLWVEFGGLVYMAFSHASRLLKQDLNPDMSIEMYQLLEDTKVKMLAQAEESFSKALELSLADDEPDEERWLYHYMLAKIAEKKQDPPRIVISRYLAASQDLHLNAAQYPAKVNYNNPQEFAVESLEMFFRVHSYIIKFMEQKDSKPLTSDIIIYFLSVTEEITRNHFYTSSEFTEKDTPSPTNPEEKHEQTKRWVRSLVSDMVEEACSEAHKVKAVDNSIEEIDSAEKASDTSKQAATGSDDEIMVVEETQEQKNKKIIIARCLEAFNLCLVRFPHHYKSLYRLSQYYHTTKLNRDNNKTRNYLIGCSFWQKVDYMPVNGLFNERKIWYQQPKNCNLFHGVWRIPNDEIDRPGSFAAHMYRCVSLALEVLPNVKDFLTTLDIALALKMAPEKDKKYLRENERQLLCEHATQVGLQAVKDKFRILFKSNAMIQRNRRVGFMFEVYRCYRHLSRHLAGTETVLGSILGQTYAALEGATGDAATLLRKAEAYCVTHNVAGQAYTPRGALPSGRGRFKRHQYFNPTTSLMRQQQPQVLASGSQYQPRLTLANNNSNVVAVGAPIRSLATHQPRFNATSVPRSNATPVPRTSATPVPRSSAAPVPRTSATPIPRSTASPLPRSTASPLPRKDPASSGSTPNSKVPAAAVTTNKNVSEEDAETISKAYTVYEHLIMCQTKVHDKKLERRTIDGYKLQLDSYQKQLLTYLKIPAVSQYFHKSLQQMGCAAAKLPAPPATIAKTPLAGSSSNKTTTSKDTSTSVQQGSEKHKQSNSASGSSTSNLRNTVPQPLETKVGSATSVTVIPKSQDPSGNKQASASNPRNISKTQPTQSVKKSSSGSVASKLSEISTTQQQSSNARNSSGFNKNLALSKGTSKTTTSTTSNTSSKKFAGTSSNLSKHSTQSAYTSKSKSQSVSSYKSTGKQSNSAASIDSSKLASSSTATLVGHSSKNQKSSVVHLNPEELLKLAYSPAKAAGAPTGATVNRKLQFAESAATKTFYTKQNLKRIPSSYSSSYQKQIKRKPVNSQPQKQAMQSSQKQMVSAYPKQAKHMPPKTHQQFQKSKAAGSTVGRANTKQTDSGSANPSFRDPLNTSDPLGKESDDDIITLD